MSKGVLAIAEQVEGVFRKVTYEALSEGRRIADHLDSELTALVLGTDVENISKELKPYGPDRIVVADSPALYEFLTDAYTNVIYDFIHKETPDIILGASTQGKDVSARLSARLNAPLAMDCVAIRFEDNSLIATRHMYGGKILADVELDGTPKILAIRPNALDITNADGAGTLEKFDVDTGTTALQFIDKRLGVRHDLQSMKAGGLHQTRWARPGKWFLRISISPAEYPEPFSTLPGCLHPRWSSP